MGLLSALYGLGLSCKKFYCRNPNRLPAKVISIGNLTLGGTGKTPAVIAVAQEAKKRGHNPCILTRGYKGKAKDIAFVSRGEGPLLNPLEAGDEAYLMAETLKRVTIIKGKDRFRAGIAAFDNAQFAIVNLQAPPLFILDDGFQHWKLHRDVDVLLIDATNPFGNEKLFPEGRLREPLRAMKRAHIIVITKADMAIQGAITAITRRIKQYNSDAPIFTASHKPAGLISASGEAAELNTLRNKQIYAFSGIANPAYFQSTLRSSGARIVEFMNFRDHHIYSRKDMDKIKSEALGLEIVTTEKDLVKLKELDIPDNLSALTIEFSIENDFYDNLFRRLQ
ncbi:MAG: tetraacyldisaccharide 4'-kinase [Nitrospirae bacterium]|nr:tetraacyldisaccharide 4'-kinase [Nitrospirota bacterium]